MLKLMRDKGATVLADIVNRLFTETGQTTAPWPYRDFFSELAHNTAISGMIQIAGKSDVLEVLERMVSGIDVRQASQKEEFKILQMHAPVIALFINKLPMTEPVPPDVCQLLEHLKNLCLVPFTIENADTFLPPIRSDGFSCFPTLPLVRRVRHYAADSRSLKEDKDSCRKCISSHPVLTPGIFTLFCSHGICYGFQILKQHKSPKHPFEIFFTRFKTMPEYIIYDNSCKLHQYILNREPTIFQNTVFMIDRFHWRGHVGCSSGYNMDIYLQETLMQTNSQINEQANSGLQQMKRYIAYMKADNFKFHVKLLLACKNMAIQKNKFIT